jgi:CRISPR system Cascade subunit CasA
MFARTSWLSLAVLTPALLTGCARYAAAPMSPTAIATAQAGRTYDPASISARLARLAPLRTTRIEGWNQLTLFAALVENNPDIVAARAAVARAIVEQRAAGAPAGPTLTLTTEYAGAAHEASPWLFGGVIDVPLDIGGRRRARIDSADLKTAMARYDFLEAIWTARQALRTALADRLIALRQAETGLQLVAVRERYFAAVSRRVAAGETTRADLERIRADLGDARRRAADAAFRIEAETCTIAALTGVPIAALSNDAVTWEAFDAPPIAEPDDALVRAALVARADILRVVAAYDQSEADLRGEIARQYPAISVGPGFTWERGLVKLPFSLGLILPPLDLNRRAIAAAEAKRSEAGRVLEAAVANASAVIIAAQAEARAAREALARIRRDELPAARQLAAQADHELRAGAIDRTDWAAAQSGALVARLAELDALARVHATDTALELALRRPMTGPELEITGTLRALL